MIDLKLLREHPEQVREAVRVKKFACDIDTILALDGERRSIVTRAEEARRKQKSASSEVAGLPKGSPEFLDKIRQMKELAGQVKELQKQQQEVDEKWKNLLLTVPNIPHESVPEGKDEQGNQIVKTWGSPAEVSAHALPHYDLPFFQKYVDLPGGAKVTGAGFPFFIGPMSRLVRALIRFFLEEATAAGYVEIMPPLMVNAASATATCQLPDKEGQMYEIPDSGFYLIPTAEVPVTNLYRDTTFDIADLPKNCVAYTPCFRREAGSYGKEVRGLNRVHQFDKVELVKWVAPENSEDALEALREDAERLLRKLELPYRLLLMCAGEIGFPHAKQYDLEVWAGGQKRWLEVSSCSNFTDFQARRANIRFRGRDGKPHHVHTLNASALALPRTIAALLENNAQEDGRIRLPEALIPYYGEEYLACLTD